MDYPHNGAAKRSFDVFFGIVPYNVLNEQFSGRWFETPQRPCDVTVIDSEFV